MHLSVTGYGAAGEPKKREGLEFISISCKGSYCTGFASLAFFAVQYFINNIF